MEHLAAVKLDRVDEIAREVAMWKSRDIDGEGQGRGSKVFLEVEVIYLALPV
jgi:hypothetical protein